MAWGETKAVPDHGEAVRVVTLYPVLSWWIRSAYLGDSPGLPLGVGPDLLV